MVHPDQVYHQFESLSAVERKQYEELKEFHSHYRRKRRERVVFYGYCLVAIISTVSILGLLSLICDLFRLQKQFYQPRGFHGWRLPPCARFFQRVHSVGVASTVHPRFIKTDLDQNSVAACHQTRCSVQVLGLRTS